MYIIKFFLFPVFVNSKQTSVFRCDVFFVFEYALCSYQMEIFLKPNVNGLALGSCSQSSQSKRESLPHSYNRKLFLDTLSDVITGWRESLCVH